MNGTIRGTSFHWNWKQSINKRTAAPVSFAYKGASQFVFFYDGNVGLITDFFISIYTINIMQIFFRAQYRAILFFIYEKNHYLIGFPS